MTTGRGFYDGTSRLYGEWLSFSRSQVKNLLWTVEIFTVTRQEFHAARARFYYERSRFS